MARSFLFFLLVLVSCGQGSELQTEAWTEGRVIRTPARVDLEGRWVDAPTMQVRQLGPRTRLVQLSGKAVVTMEPAVDGLAEALVPEKNEGFEWGGPAAGACPLGQAQVSRDQVAPYAIRFLLWGWDQGNKSDCHALLDRIRQEGFQVRFKRVKVANSPDLAELAVALAPGR